MTMKLIYLFLLFINVFKASIFKSSSNIIKKTNLFYESNFLAVENINYHQYDGIIDITNKNKSLKVYEKNSYKLGFYFDLNFDNFKDSKRIKKLGFQIQIRRYNSSISEDYLYEINNFKELFQSDGKRYIQKNKDYYSEFDIRYSGENYLNNFLLEFYLNLEKNDEIDFFRLIYSSDPIFINKIYLSNYDVNKSINLNSQEKIYNDSLFTIINNNETTYSYICEYGRTYSKNYLLSKFIFYDEKIVSYFNPNQIIDTDNYFLSGSDSKIGSQYELTLLGIDSSNNKHHLKIILKILDTLPPVIENLKDIKEITISYKTNFNDTNFLYKYFNITDNFNNDIDIQLKTINNKNIENKVGKVNAKIIAIDKFKNKSEMNIILNLIDDIKPMFDKKYSFIYLNELEALSIDELLSYISSYDEIDKNCPINIISNPYLNNEDKEGKYEIKFLTQDKSNNKIEDSIFITVKKKGHRFYSSENTITFFENDTLSDYEIINSLIDLKLIPDKKYQRIQINDDKQTNDFKVGFYQVKVKLFDIHNNNEEVNINFEVLKNDNSSSEQEVKLSFFQKIINFFKNIWLKIKNFFKKLFNIK